MLVDILVVHLVPIVGLHVLLFKRGVTLVAIIRRLLDGLSGLLEGVIFQVIAWEVARVVRDLLGYSG